jgi:zinc protease
MKKHTILLWFFILCLPAGLHYALRSLPAKIVAPQKTIVPQENPRTDSVNTAHSSANTVLPETLNPRPHNIQTWTTAKGAKVYFIENHTLPMVDITLSLDAGSSRDAENPGLAALWLNLLDQGTTQWSADQIAEQFDNTGALFHSNLSKDRATLTLRSLSDPKILSALTDLLASLIATPAFSESSIASIKAQQLITIQQKQQKPAMIAQDAFFAALYGHHPYAHPGLGSEKSLASIGPQALHAFHERYSVAKNSSITLVGNLSVEDAKQLSEKLVHALPEGMPAPALEAVTRLQASAEQRIDYRSEQTHIMMGAPCMAEGDPDFFALLLGNYLLGQNGLSNELFNEVREKRGLAYHVGSSLHTLKEPGPFMITLETKNTQTQEAIDCVKETLRRFLKEGPTEEALEMGKKSLIRSFPLTINSNAKLSEALSTMAFYGLPLDFLDTYQEKIQSLTRAQVQAALQKHLDPEKMVLIVVGPESNIPPSAARSTPLKGGV